MTETNPPISVTVTITLDLTVTDVWPDGDGPDNWTAQDVLDVIKKEETAEGFLDGWGCPGADVHVYVAGKTARGSLR